MTVLSFEVSSVPFVFITVLSCIFYLGEVFQVFIKCSLKIMMFLEDFLKDSLYCDFLCCMCCSASLEEV
jgi:hypothetical protein